MYRLSEGGLSETGNKAHSRLTLYTPSFLSTRQKSPEPMNVNRQWLHQPWNQKIIVKKNHLEYHLPALARRLMFHFGTNRKTANDSVDDQLRTKSKVITTMLRIYNHYNSLKHKKEEAVKSVQKDTTDFRQEDFNLFIQSQFYPSPIINCSSIFNLYTDTAFCTDVSSTISASLLPIVLKQTKNNKF